VGAKVMKDDILKKLDLLLTETNWNEQKDETLEAVRKSREDGVRAEDIVKDNVDEDEEKDSDEETDSDRDDDSDEEADSSEEELQKVVNLEEASNYEKLEDALNLFKSGKSLSNEEIKEEMKSYHSKLTPNEQKALFVFIKGLNQITLMDISGKAANTPKSMSISIGAPGALSKDKKKADMKMKKSKEDAEKGINTPITIGSGIQEKKEILKIVESNG
tara:strand:+ start:31 stop:684 length:654 start_codon:yes stop_codon:yes gene_type:complete